MILNPISDGPKVNFIKVPECAVEKLTKTGNTLYLAVYMRALCEYYNGKVNISNRQIADLLHINVMDVVNAFLFCSSEGLVKVHNFTSVADAEFDVEFVFDAKGKVNTLDFKPNYKTGEIAKRISENPKLSQIYKIVSGILGKNLSSADTEILYSMYDYYGLPAEVIAVMVEYFSGKGKTTMRALEREAQKWAELEITSVLKANTFIKKREELLSYAGKVRQIIGANERKLTTKELEYINKWQNDFKVSLDDVRLAYEKTVENTGKVAFQYMNKILEGIAKKPRGEDVKKPLKTSPEQKKSRYDYDEIDRKTFKKSANKGGELNGV